ncbi:Phox homologous domain-containing protein [Naematelia encephala]|uniref:Endosomal/vacuolar adapter protein YPT35 n=1 Tax=Naematelia encephala TaxID=71784 RepID=A0A1Y2B1F2_9TREE|nr:Phox homologous domain-containing protein [Naematelia encephala]
MSRTGSAVALSPSPSISSLTSEEEAFDHTVRIQPESTSILGLREMASLKRLERDNQAASRRDAMSKRKIELLKAVHPSLKSGEGGDQGKAGRVSPVSGTFASDVRIRGWKMVGGRTWSDKAKVGAYVVYEIEIVLRSGGSMEILKRYTDFVVLRTALKAAYPHLRQAIPQLPGKSHLSKFNPDFLADRQPRLQRFLRTVLLHPEMGRGGQGSVVGGWVTG